MNFIILKPTNTVSLSLGKPAELTSCEHLGVQLLCSYNPVKPKSILRNSYSPMLGSGQKAASPGSLQVASIHSEGPGLRIWLIQRVDLALYLAVAVDMHPLQSSYSIHGKSMHR